MLEITVGHWPFSDQFQDLADQNPLCSLLYIFNGTAISNLQNVLSLKTADHFQIVISITARINVYFMHNIKSYSLGL